jgi:hypothetical protein
LIATVDPRSSGGSYVKRPFTRRGRGSERAGERADAVVEELARLLLKLFAGVSPKGVLADGTPVWLAECD